MTPKARSIVVWTLVAVVGAVCWAVLALSRGEDVSALWILFAALSSYLIAYRFYSRFLARTVLRLDDTRATPAERLDDGADFEVTDKRVLFGHHFAAIAGAGPLVGPVLAAQMGYLPGTLWIIVGVIFAGAVQDMVVLFLSLRRDGKSLGQMVREEIGVVGGTAALIAVFAIMIIILAVLSLVVVNALAESPWGVFSIGLTIPIALFMGCYLRFVRPGRVLEVTGIGVVLLLLAIVGGGYVETWGLADSLTLSKETLTVCLVVYGFVASILPVWLLLTPRDYLSTFMKIGVILLLAVGLVLATPVLQNDAVTSFATEGNGPVFAGKLFPFLFITIACGALSGFHALIASGTTPKMVGKESHVRMIGYGGMLMESFVAISALIAASVIDQGLYFAMNAPAGMTGGTVEGAVEFVNGLGFTLSPDQLNAAAAAVEEELVSRTGGAPTLALGISTIFSDAFGGNLAAFWYHFAIMFEALFILTAVDAGTRVGRFMVQDTVGNVWKRYADTTWKPAAWSASAVVVACWGYMLYVGVTDPLGGINQLFPLFGIANQLLAAIALTLCVTLFLKHGWTKWVWVPAVPLAWDLVTTMTASYQKVFSSDPTIGYFAQADRYREARDVGEVLAPAADASQMATVITNSTVNGVLQASFAVLVIVIVANAAVIWVRALRAGSLPTTEVPHVPSQLPPDGAQEREPVGAGR
ncbi:carbon starvation CstA family protein [Nocardioides lianchengensis]|uniref:Carbon starvation protein n=1 Tax=Nocardioides lianchengensis TaxID=1045774 RepID=A0A1G6RKK1_9ACTN|nr:carbon starvation CstA family protein [Nocardioides lianchengensis]NYG10219.1 carbon starvation protein [Nocardioides lianchengensis]SDD04525.1 carbon starvation protein [Nocardioides lianchengensis]